MEAAAGRLFREGREAPGIHPLNNVTGNTARTHFCSMHKYTHCAAAERVGPHSTVWRERLTILRYGPEYSFCHDSSTGSARGSWERSGRASSASQTRVKSCCILGKGRGNDDGDKNPNGFIARQAASGQLVANLPDRGRALVERRCCEPTRCPGGLCRAANSSTAQWV